VSFPCPGCLAAIDASLFAWLPRCPACGGRVRARPVEAAAGTRTYEVEIVGRPETRRTVEVPWTAADHRRLTRWLFWSSLITLGLVGVLFLLALFAR
jgi:hypothetical protein